MATILSVCLSETQLFNGGFACHAPVCRACREGTFPPCNLDILMIRVSPTISRNASGVALDQWSKSRHVTDHLFNPFPAQ
eukprot:13419194-Ditylum_brightwellii.AAC.1